jgi:hypothetical protein
VRQLAGPAHTGLELLTTLIVTVSTMAFEQAASAVRKRQDSLMPVEGHTPDQALITQVSMAVVPRIAQVALRDNSECADGREGAAVLAIELVGAIALVDHNLALETAWQVEPFDERVSGVAVAVAISIPVMIAFSVALVLIPITRIVPPRVVNAVVLTRIAVAVTWIKAVEHTRLPPVSDRHVQRKPLRGVGPADVRVGPLRRLDSRLRPSEFGCCGAFVRALGATTSGNSTSVDVEDEISRAAI